MKSLPLINTLLPYTLLSTLLLSISACSPIKNKPSPSRHSHFTPNKHYEQKIARYQQNRDPQNDPCFINGVAASNNIQLLQYLIDKARSTQTLKKQLRCTGNATATPLGFAVANHAYQAAELLLKQGADASDRGEETDPPIMQAVSQKQLKLVSLLLQYGADKNLNYNFQASQIKAAGAAMVALFLKQGGNPKRFAYLKDISI